MSEVKTDHLRIEMKYKMTDSDDWYKLDMTPRVYFDFDMLDEGEELEVGSIPVYMHPFDYFDDENHQISQISVDIIDLDKNARLHFFQLFWNQQNHSILEVVETVNGTVERER